MHTHTHTAAKAAAKTRSTLDVIRADLRKALKRYAEANRGAIEAGVHIGNLAREAKALIPHGQFGPWLDINFSNTRQWIACCMRASKAWEVFQERDDKHRVFEFTSVERLAAAYQAMKDGGDPWGIAPRWRAPKAGMVTLLRARVAYLESVLIKHGIPFNKA